MERKEKFRPALLPYIIQWLKEVKRVRHKYYREKKICNTNEETSVVLLIMTQEVKIEIAENKSNKWQQFLSKIQATHENKEKAFWSCLSRVYKPKSLTF